MYEGKTWSHNTTLYIKEFKDADPIFMYYFLKTLELGNFAGGSAVPTLNRNHIHSLMVAVPSVGTQKKIARILQCLDRKIKLNERINDNLFLQLDSIYHSIYSYLPSDGLPEGWDCVPLGTLCDSISVKHLFNKEELIFLNTGDIENGQFLHETYSPVENMPGQAKKSIKLNDILYSEIRPINRHFAFVNFSADDYVVSTKLMVIRSREIDSRRLYHFLTMQDTINKLQVEAESRSGTFPQIRFENDQCLPMIIAPPDVESQFTQILKDYYSMMDSNNLENQHLLRLRNAMLPKLMSGELDVSAIDF